MFSKSQNLNQKNENNCSNFLVDQLMDCLSALSFWSDACVCCDDSSPSAALRPALMQPRHCRLLLREPVDSRCWWKASRLCLEAQLLLHSCLAYEVVFCLCSFKELK